MESSVSPKEERLLMEEHVLKTETNRADSEKRALSYRSLHSARVASQALLHTLHNRKDTLPGVDAVGGGVRSWDGSTVRRVFGFLPDGLELPPSDELSTKYSA